MFLVSIVIAILTAHVFVTTACTIALVLLLALWLLVNWSDSDVNLVIAACCNMQSQFLPNTINNTMSYWTSGFIDLKADTLVLKLSSSHTYLQVSLFCFMV